MSSFKAKKVIFDKNIEFYPASLQDLDKHHRLMRRWALQMLKCEGVNIAYANDVRVIEYLDQLESKLKKKAKTAKQKLRIALVIRILCYPIIFVKNLFVKLFTSNRN